MSTSIVRYELIEGTAVIHMDDGKANALSDAMIDALLEALARAEGEARATVLTGRPDRFCAGFDLRTIMAGPDEATALLRRGAQLLMKLYGFGVPLVTACTGHALAGGALVGLTGDLRIGAAGAYKVGLNEVSIGLPVPMLALAIARDRLATAELSRATLGAQIYAPADALRAGFFDEVVAPDQVLPRALAEATRLGGYPRAAFAGTKTRLRGKTIEHVLATLDEDMRLTMSGRGPG
jgi:enoyl-CoA hydratase